MKTNFYLAINSRGTVRVSNNKKPLLAVDEVAVHIQLEIPNAAFVRPQFTASLQVREESVTPVEITVEQVEGIREAIETGTGMHVTMSIAQEPK